MIMAVVLAPVRPPSLDAMIGKISRVKLEKTGVRQNSVLDLV